MHVHTLMYAYNHQMHLATGSSKFNIILLREPPSAAPYGHVTAAVSK